MKMYQFDEESEPTLEDILNDARKRIEVEDDEIEEARERRDRMGAALRDEFPGSTTYMNGSVAHGDALTPLTDVDLGVVVAAAVDSHGPGKKGPRDLMDRAAEAIRNELKEDYPKLSVTVEGQTRAVLVRFRDPVTPGAEDFTADVLVTVENKTGAGLYIPNVPGWDRSHPQKHTELIRQANKDSRYTFARGVRLLKHWCRQNGKPMCSWNIKALALGCLYKPLSMLDALETWFDYAYKELGKGLTTDPAKVTPDPIELNESKAVVLDRLKDASRTVKRARSLEADGYLLMAQQQLADLFNDEEMLPYPDGADLLAESGRHRREHMPAVITSSTVAATAPKTQSWRS